MRRSLFIAAGVVLLLGSPVAEGQILFVASMDGSQEVPSNNSQAQGTAWAVLSEDLATLTYSVTYASLDSTFTAAHFHVSAPGVAGPVVFPLTFAGNTASGTWASLPDSIVPALVQGKVYVNIHSTSYPAGEIRGHLTMASAPGFSISLSPSQEVPPVASGATGTGWAWLDTTGNVQYRVTIAGLRDSLHGAHFHVGPPGVSGPVVRPASFSDSTSEDMTAPFADSLLIRMLKGEMYFNVHSKTYPEGELRGQLTLATGIRFTMCMDGWWLDPIVRTIATGAAWGIFSQDLSSLAYRITYADLDSTFTGAHFHVAPSNAIVHPINFNGSTAEGRWDDFPDTMLPALLRGDLYVNIHSAKYPSAEIRGYVMVARGMEFTISMDADQEIPPTGTGAAGTGWAVLDSSGARLFYHSTFAGLSDAFRTAHFHSAPPGVAGPIVHPVTFINSTALSVWTGFPDSILANLLKGNIYLNVHSVAHPAGEIRGNLLYRQASSTGAEVVAESGIPASFRLEQNYPNPFNPGTEIEFHLNRAALVSLKVFNLLGQEVATLVNDVKPAGVYRVAFDASNLSSGVYFYRLAADNGLSALRKMMLIR